jgi:signal transduction histidine kinase
VSVADTGRGMSSDEVARLFRIDVRLATQGTEGEHGNGIGLILCHELVSLNKGKIEVTSEPGKGSTFTLVLPAAGPDSG